MNRRQFLRTTAGFTAIMVSPGVFSIFASCNGKKSYPFRSYQEGSASVPVKIVTPDDGFYIHTFYDVNPFSPGGRLLAVTRLPFQKRRPEFGDKADICIIDLENETIETVYSTKGWGFQLGANLNWGSTDRYIYTNDIIGNEAVCVRIDLKTKEMKAFSGPKYHLSPDGSHAIGFPLDLINVTQKGYGVPQFRELEKISGAPADEGLWETNQQTDEKRLLVSLKEAADNASDKGYLEGGNFYFFHSKYNPQGTKILQVMRCLFPDNPDKRGWNPMLFVFNSDGSDIHEAVSRLHWGYGGNHPNWHPDGRHIIMNLRPKWLGEDKMRFCMFHHTGKDFRIIDSRHLGSGHPSVDPKTKYLISDCYQHEPMAKENGHVPIRFIHLETGDESEICSVFTDLDIKKSTLRVDPHPAWDGNYKRICFNGAPDGKRQVFVAEMESVL